MNRPPCTLHDPAVKCLAKRFSPSVPSSASNSLRNGGHPYTVPATRELAMNARANKAFREYFPRGVNADTDAMVDQNGTRCTTASLSSRTPRRHHATRNAHTRKRKVTSRLVRARTRAHARPRRRRLASNASFDVSFCRRRRFISYYIHIQTVARLQPKLQTREANQPRRRRRRKRRAILVSTLTTHVDDDAGPRTRAGRIRRRRFTRRSFVCR